MSRENSYATLDSGGDVPADQLGNVGAVSHPDLATHDALGIATDAELATHAADTTSVHGITDAAVLATDTEVATAVSDHSADTTAVHGITDTAALSLTSHDHDADYEAAGGIATHAAAADPHGGYLKESDFDDVDFLVGTATGLTAAEIVVGTTPGGELGGTWASPTVDATHSGSTHGAAVTTHEAAADPHTGYQKESEKSAVSGYASLDAGTKVPIAELPTGTSGTTVALGDAAAGLITTHEGAANPHATYETSAEAQAKVDAHTGDAADAHDASAVSVVPAGAIVATDVQAALEELDTEKSATAHTHTHAATTGQTVDDHHARDHAINGATHTGTLDDGQIPASIARDAEVAAAYQPLDSDLTAIAALATTAFGRALLELADSAAMGAAHTHSGASTLYAPGTFTVATGNFNIMADLLELTGVQVVTLEGSAVLALI